MCLAIPSRVVEISGDLATVERFGESLKVSLALMTQPVAIGDYVVVQARAHAVHKLNATEAREAYRLFEELGHIVNSSPITEEHGEDTLT